MCKERREYIYPNRATTKKIDLYEIPNYCGTI